MNFATPIQQTIARLQKELPNLAAVYPNHSWESTAGGNSFAVVLCHNGKYFGGQLMRVLTVVGAPGEPPRYYLEILKGTAIAFASLDGVVEYLHVIGQAFSNETATPHPPD